MEDKEVEFGDCGDNFKDQTWRCRHGHTVDKQVPLTTGGKHYVDENGILQQPAWTKQRVLLHHHDISCCTCLNHLLLVQGR